MLGPNHTYATEFLQRTENIYPSNRDAGISILESYRSDINDGYLRTFANIVSAEVFADFLEMAKHLSDQGYKDPAASLCGAVLEDGLRRIANNYSIAVTDKDDLNSLRDKCFQKNVVDKLALQEINAWTTIRNSADHGKFGAYDARQVKGMIDGVRSFLAKHLT